MRCFYCLLALTVLLAACGEKSTSPGAPAPASEPTPRGTLPLSDFDFRKLEGLYQGDFGGSGIRLTLSHATGRHATGFTLHKGLRRNFSGPMQAAGSGFSFVLNEPGDNPYDGVFSFAIDTGSLQLSGSWKPFKAEATGAKTFTLKKTAAEAPDTSGLWEPNRFNDTLGGTYEFREGGLAIYQTYHDKSGHKVRQLMTIRGNWSRTGDRYTVDWGANDLLPQRHMSLTKRTDTAGEWNGYTYMLMENGQRLFAEEAP